jgi:hypothetical protein
MENARLRFGIISRWLPPQMGGIVDHSVNLAEDLRRRGHEAMLIGSRGEAGAHVHLVADDWSARGLGRLKTDIEAMGLDHLVLQFTPLTYAGRNRSGVAELRKIWRALGIHLTTSLIVHETYFRSPKVPASLLTGTLEKAALRAMCQSSEHVFAASEPLCREMACWRLRAQPVLLPIGSNIPVVEADVPALRRRHGLAPGTLVLTLFGGGNNLKWRLDHVRSLSAALDAEGVAHAWLLLGGTPRAWLPPKAVVLDPGWLPHSHLSAYLQLTDIFLMPSWSGVNAKRGTLMAALEHALPVIGTRGYMTDPFLSEVKGMVLTDQKNVAEFCREVLALAQNSEARTRMGQWSKAYFHDNFTRDQMIDRFLSAIGALSMAK